MSNIRGLGDYRNQGPAKSPAAGGAGSDDDDGHGHGRGAHGNGSDDEHEGPDTPITLCEKVDVDPLLSGARASSDKDGFVVGGDGGDGLFRSLKSATNRQVRIRIERSRAS